MALMTASPSETMTQARAIALLTELLEAFSRKTFQKKMGKLIQKHGGSTNMLPIQHLDGRRELAFQVQREILPKHGFSADEAGVVAMKTALRAHLGEPEIVEKSRAARIQLRLPLMEVHQVAPSEGEDIGLPAPCETPPCETPAASRPEPVKPKPAPALATKSITVCNPLDNGSMTVFVRHVGSYPTVNQVKAAIVEQLGENSEVDHSNFRLVVSGGGGSFGTRADHEVVRLQRVLAVGVTISAVGA